MFHNLDDTLKKLLDAAPPTGADDLFINAHISFDTPEKGFKPTQGDVAINLFLYEIKEDRDLRQPVPDKEFRNGQSVRKRAPLRVDCAYMVTAWSNIPTQDNVSNSHKLLGQAFNWLSRFPVIPDHYLQLGGLTGQYYGPPAMVAQMDGAKSAGEFWHALGIPPRPYFNLVVTITMDLDQHVEDTIVTTVSSRYQQRGAAGADEVVTIGGTARDRHGAPVADAWVRLESPVPAQTQTQVTDAVGHYIFDRVAYGTGYTLRARASGHADATRLHVAVPSMTGEYDIAFT
jgi:hypothetical protein